jgi:hypothetical protein
VGAGAARSPVICLGGWDLALVAAVSAMIAVVALLRAPRRKAMVLAFPVPFTIASLAVGRPLDATHVVALGLLFGYTLAVHALHRRARVALLPSIALSVGGFVAAATLLNRLLPRDDAAFWIALAATLVAGVALLRALPRLEEPGVRDEVPLHVKLPIAVATTVGLVLLKGAIGGFMTLFPMVGVLASYENRHGLWANVRQIPVVMVTMLPLMATSRLTEPALGLAASLALGWVPFLFVLAPSSSAAGASRPPSRLAPPRRPPRRCPWKPRSWKRPPNPRPGRARPRRRRAPPS